MKTTKGDDWMNNKYTDETPMPFGKHKGEKLANVPASYLLWLYCKGELKPGALRDYIDENMDEIRQEKANGG